MKRIPRHVTVGDGTPFRSASVRERDDVEIAWRWRLVGRLRVLAVCVAVWMFAYAFFAEGGLPRLLAIAAAAAALYVALVQVTSSTIVRLVGDRLEVTHGPLPWPAGAVHIDDVDGLEVVDVARAVGLENGPSTCYEIRAVDRHGARKALMRELDRDRAQFVVDCVHRVLDTAPAQRRA